MKASFQPLVGIIRIHPEGGDYITKDPYDWFTTASIVDDTAYINGAYRSPKPSEWKALKKLFKSLNITKVIYQRSFGKEVTINL